MTVELISVGTEILMGNIVNTNAAYLSVRCAQLGLSMYHQQVVGDNEERLAETVRTAAGRSDIVILTGGLGPTQDDLTKEAVAKAFGVKLVEDSAVVENIRDYMKNVLNKEEIPENNWKQAMVFENGKVLFNSNGTAPGLILKNDHTHIILLPGPPQEMKNMFEEQVVPYINGLHTGVIYSQTVKICGVSESQAEMDTLDLISTQTNPTIATYAKMGEVHFRVTANAQSLEAAKNYVYPVVKVLKSRFKDNVYSTDEEETLEEVVVELLKKKGLTLVTAESCTAGMLSARIVNVSGASDVFKQGFVTYSNKAKRKMLDVDKGTLHKFGAVSEQTAKEMAKGGIFNTDADVCVSITGVAGPNSEEDKPVGLVYIGCCMGGKVVVKEYRFSGNRQKIRENATTKALDLLRRCLLEG